MRKTLYTRAILPALAAASALAAPAGAAIFIDGISSISPVAAANDFKSDLNTNYGLTSQTNSFSSISLTAPARITFYALASESGYQNTFSFEGLSSTEQNFAFDTSRVIGTVNVAAGSLSGLSFTSNVGVPGSPGNPHFAVFLPTGFSGTTFSGDWVVFGYDDSNRGDDDFDDFIIGAQISPIPEPQAWALMVAGFGLVGWQLRRGRKRQATALF